MTKCSFCLTVSNTGIAMFLQNRAKQQTDIGRSFRSLIFPSIQKLMHLLRSCTGNYLECALPAISLPVVYRHIHLHRNVDELLHSSRILKSSNSGYNSGLLMWFIAERGEEIHCIFKRLYKTRFEGKWESKQ